MMRGTAMFSYIWPLALVVLSNIVYQICTKSAPQGMDPFAVLTVTYLTGAAAAFLLYLIFNRHANLLQEYKKLNWAPFVLGLVIVGLEVGYIYAYRAGWSVSVAPIVQAAALAVIMIFVGRLLYKEGITWNKLTGIALCIAGLVLINLKK